MLILLLTSVYPMSPKFQRTLEFGLRWLGLMVVVCGGWEFSSGGKEHKLEGWNLEDTIPINQCVFLWNFNIFHKDWSTFSGGTENNYWTLLWNSISNNLNQMFNFLAQIHDCDSYNTAFLDLFIHSHWEILIMLLSQFLLTYL